MFDGRRRLSFYPNLSDGGLAEVQRLSASSPEPEPAPRKRQPRSRVHVILDSDVVKRRLRALGLTAGQVAKRLHICVWDPQALVDFCEVTPGEAVRLARALGVDVAEITYGMRRLP